MKCLGIRFTPLRLLVDDYWQRIAGNCHSEKARRRSAPWLVFAVLFLWFSNAFAHGGVVMEEDQCVIDIGLFRAHFTIYQPHTRASEEFCEEVPDLGETIFVMDYLHESLRRMPVDFRIITDVNDRKQYASWEDVQEIDDLDGATVFYQGPRVEAQGSLTARTRIEAPGWYIGIATTKHPTLEQRYNAVFGFHVGGKGLGWWPLLLLIALVVQLHFWISGGGLKRWRQRRETAQSGGDE